MSKIAVLTDSSASIYNVKHSYDFLFSIDLPCFLGEKIFTDFAVNGNEPFFAALENTDVVPKTSQPSVGESLEMFEKIKALGYTDIIFLPISKELSGTYQNAYLAKEMVKGVNVEIINTRTTASLLGSLVLEACKLVDLGKSVAEIVEQVETLRENQGYYFTINDLTALVKNGRLSNAKSIKAR